MKLAPDIKTKKINKITAIFTIIYGFLFIITDIFHYYYGIRAEKVFLESGIMELLHIPYELIEHKKYNLIIHLVLILAGIAMLKKNKYCWYLYNFSFVGLILKYPVLISWDAFFRVNWIESHYITFILSVGGIIYFNKKKVKKSLRTIGIKTVKILLVNTTVILIILSVLSYKVNWIPSDKNTTIFESEIISPQLDFGEGNNTFEIYKNKPDTDYIEEFDTTELNDLVDKIIKEFETNKDSLYKITCWGNGVEGGSEDVLYFDSKFNISFYSTSWASEGYKEETIYYFNNKKANCLYSIYYDPDEIEKIITKIYCNKDTIWGYQTIRNYVTDTTPQKVKFLSKEKTFEIIGFAEKFYEQNTSKIFCLTLNDLELSDGIYHSKSFKKENDDLRSSVVYTIDTLTYKIMKLMHQ